MASPYFEDIEIGHTREFDERYEVTETEIVEFGRRYEPWIQHVDPAAAHESEYVERLTAGTFHICAMGLRLIYDCFLADSGALDSVAVDDAWREYQVLPGDSLGILTEAVDTRVLSETRGVVSFEVAILEREEDLTVMTMTVSVTFKRRPSD